MIKRRTPKSAQNLGQSKLLPSYTPTWITMNTVLYSVFWIVLVFVYMISVAEEQPAFGAMSETFLISSIFGWFTILPPTVQG